MVFNKSSNKFNKKFNRGGRNNNHHKGQHGFRREFQRNNKPSFSTPIEKLTEAEVGITEYMTEHPGFEGVIKQRFSDFQVNEINLDGVVAELTDKSVPVEFEKSEPLTEEEILNSKSNTELISDELWQKIKDSVFSQEVLDVVELDVTLLSKEERSKIHESVKEAFGQRVVTNTKSSEAKKVITFQKFGKLGKTDDRRVRWPKNFEEYLHFIMYKEHVDTMEACYKISDCLKMKTSNITYAGVKDRRAKTTQWLCIHKISPIRLLEKLERLKCIKIGNFAFKKEPLKLGQLKGNRFRIALRNVNAADDEVITTILNDLKEKGFVNYYGLQRFGQCKEVPTHTIGVQLLLGNWEEVCNMLLKVKKTDDPKNDITKAKKCYEETKDVQAAHNLMVYSRNRCIESKLMQGLLKTNKNDYINALENIPRNTRLLYLHAFQSFVWNKVASKRLQIGLEVLVGDLVLASEDDNIIEDVDNPNANNSDDEDSTTDENKFETVKILTESDVSNYTIYDIVLPLPGYDVTYPENELKQYYKEILEDNGLSLEMPQQRVKTYTLSGAYRKILKKVENLTWKIMKYNEPEDNLILSDVEKLEQIPEPVSIEGGQYKAIVLDFCLPSSSYATMVLREILKMDTSSTTHAKLNDYHIQDSKTTKKGIEHINDTSVKAEETTVDDGGSLLKSEGYSAFLESVFGSAEQGTSTSNDENGKRSLEDADEDNSSKKVKL